ncbi:MAG: 2-succinyl-5-enolpyruvyl-6-hydroxy-3-cyclohexene-1-carboxylic-acid synthase [Holophagales bacterium]|nr:2-succinyl-5-enolpyruvyl-6-hydroxy-3-cyclohexene-1-carboxylic-acid synthase [Holophagales bacterium]
MGLAGAAAGEAQFQRARLLVGALMRAGVRRAVTSPGSRSTPLVLAALDAAAAGLDVASIVDERAAGFFALGQARATGMPTVLICTSGTAPAHYLPAMMEAREAGVPLIALTADRPIELMDCAAPQTTDQTKLFGSFVNHFAEVDLAGPVDPLSLRAIRRTAAQAVFRSRWPRPAAVHMNVRARKPLEPEAGAGDGSLAAAVDALLGEPIEAAVPAAQPDPAALDRAAALCRRAERGLIVAGALPLPLAECRRDGDVWGLAKLARRTGFPLLAEATSQSRFTEGDSAADAARLGAAWRAAGGEGLPLPDLILQVGAPPVAVGAQRLIEAGGAPQIVLSDGPWTDPAGLASVFLFGNVGRSTSELCRRLEDVGPGDEAAGWREDVLGLCGRFRAAVASPGPEGPGFHDGEAAAVAVAATPADALLMLGNSLPVRLIETWAAHPGRRVWVASQRGLSGIDGSVAGFLGSLGAGGFPAGLLLAGDVSLLHDLDGLAIAPEYGAGPPAVVVVIDNQGGRIFDRLPIAKAEVFQGPAGRHWLTPHGVDFGGLARAFGVPYARVEGATALAREIGAALGRPGVSLIVAGVAPGALTAAEESLRRAMRAASSSR